MPPSRAGIEDCGFCYGIKSAECAVVLDRETKVCETKNTCYAGGAVFMEIGY